MKQHPMVLLALAVLAVCCSGCMATRPATTGAPTLPVKLWMPSVLGHNMVVQRDRPVPVWGLARPGDTVAVRFGTAMASGTADAQGRWKVILPPRQAGGPFDLTVKASTTITLTNVLVGEVWLASGQSNMEWTMARLTNSAAEIAQADWPRLRFAVVGRRPAGEPTNASHFEWAVCSTGTASRMSAVAYYFARELHQRLQVPVGVVVSAWGGTAIEPWIPAEAFEAEPALQPISQEVRQAQREYNENIRDRLDLMDGWLVEARMAVAEGRDIPPLPIRLHALAGHQKPTGLYNGMIAPLVPFALRGAIWYQGESNVGAEPERYQHKLRALVNGWRTVWGQGDFPFYYVQLAPYRYYRNSLDGATRLCRLWESQVAALAITNTGMAVTTDIATVDDIHPPNKRDVGLRLALWALARDYGFTNLVHSGPLYRSAAIEPGRIRVRFDHVGGGLVSRDGGPLTWWEVAGADRVFKPAVAVIEGDTVVVAAPEVARPLSVHFGWSEEAQPNLMNKEGLPASPFRSITDEAGWQRAARDAGAGL